MTNSPDVPRWLVVVPPLVESTEPETDEDTPPDVRVEPEALDPNRFDYD